MYFFSFYLSFKYICRRITISIIFMQGIFKQHHARSTCILYLLSLFINLLKEIELFCITSIILYITNSFCIYLKFIWISVHFILSKPVIFHCDWPWDFAVKGPNIRTYIHMYSVYNVLMNKINFIRAQIYYYYMLQC